MAYKCLSAFEQVALQKQNEHLKLLVIAAAIFGYLMCGWINPHTINSVNAWLDKQPLAERYDFIDARLNPDLRRMIAEHWCLQNPSTVRVCHNAVLYSRPVK